MIPHSCGGLRVPARGFARVKEFASKTFRIELRIDSVASYHLLQSIGVRAMRSKTKAGRYARLKEPLVRDGGELRPAGWDEALDRAAVGLRKTIDRYGPRAFGMFSCSKT